MSAIIAVILPIYNQEQYLSRALDSLATQTSRDFVAICVNDGSTDATAEILADYERRAVFPMHVITKANGGVSSARNAGLDLAVTLPNVTHVSFLDPDDLIHPQCCEIVSRFAAARPDEVLEWGFSHVGKELRGEFLSRRYVIEGVVAGLFEKGPSACNKAFPVAAVREVRFNERISIAEDMAFVHETCSRGHLQGTRLHVDLYYYDENPTSTTNRSLGVKDFCERRAALNYMIALYKDDSAAHEEFARRALPSLLKRFYHDLRRVRPAERVAARSEFAACLADVRRTSRVYPCRGSVKDLKYYLLFRYMIWRAQGRRAY